MNKTKEELTTKTTQYKLPESLLIKQMLLKVLS